MQVLTALRASHERLAAALAAMTDAQLAAPSYDDEWSIAQLASHLGSGAEVYGLFLDAGLHSTSAPGIDQFRPVWDRWNAKSPVRQRDDLLEMDAALADRIAALSDADRAAWRLEMFGTDQNLSGLLRMRLGEHALHTWDAAVALDPTATVPVDAAALIVDSLPELVGRVGKPSADAQSIVVTTVDPDRMFRLDIDASGARLASLDGGGAPGARLRLPAEAFIRLVYGRLDPDHTPDEVEADGVDLDSLRRTFPGV
ncbi:MAG: hypothetical protein QOG80_2758 [Pseudonocardiales bacterium]|jgi:uncharacterized protein (TIGR03083 family)|nr:hypothetical protein [Pseudonocardiales bacterium]